MSACSKNDRNILAVLQQAGYCSNQKKTDTLQGSIWSSRSQNNGSSVIIKVTSRKLHKESVIIYDGKKYNVDENIIKEKDILKYLSSKKRKQCDHIVQYLDFFKSNSRYYLIMEHGGHMLFDFVVRVHRYIQSKKLDIVEWHKLIKIIFVQILDAVQYIHDHNVVHYDISLENLLINDVEVILDSNGKIKFITDNIVVKLCDFGLAERNFDDQKNEEYVDYVHEKSTKFCGKPNYKSPECTSKQPFNAKANDVWCVGVVLFMMLIGGNMVNKATMNDKAFEQIINGHIDQLLIKWKRIQYVDRELIDLFNKIFVFEHKRINIQQIQQHSWLNHK